MTSRSVRRARLQVEALESRWAPATRVSPTVLTYHDADGDPVRVVFSRPILTSDLVANNIFKFSNGNVDNSDVAQQQLWEIDLTGVAGARGTDIRIALNGDPASVGDGQVHVGFINAEGVDLGKVNVHGDLGRILVGDDDFENPGLKALRAMQMGAKGLTTQAAGGSLLSGFIGPVGKVVVSGSVKDAELKMFGGLGLLNIGGDLQGGSANESGSVGLLGRLAEVRIGGSVVGGGGTESGVILAIGIGNVNIRGSVLGGTGYQSGRIFSAGRIGDVVIGGSIRGGTTNSSGTIQANGDIAAVTVAGSLIGGSGESSGSITTRDNIGSVSIAGDVAATPTGGQRSAQIHAEKIKRVAIGGNLQGGGGFESGQVTAFDELGSVIVKGDLIASTGLYSGWITSDGNIGELTIRGSILGASVVAKGSLGDVSVGANIFGAAGARALILAGGDLDDDDGPARIASLTVGGSVHYADILAGYRNPGPGMLARSNADATIGRVKVGENWLASNVAAGVDRGADGLFGSPDDGAVVAGSPDFISSIGRITIGGILDGTTTAGDRYGFVAELVKALAITGNNQVLNPGALNDADGVTTASNTNDFGLLERQA